MATSRSTPTSTSWRRYAPRLVTLAVLSLSLGACGGGGSGATGASAPAQGSLFPASAPHAVDIAPAASAPAGTASAPPSASVPSLQSQIAALEQNGSIPQLDRSSDIAGPDLNRNGVRDDVETSLDALVLTAAQRRAALQDARALQSALTVDLTDKAALQRIGDAMMASVKCSGENFRSARGVPDALLSGKIEGMTANTRERVQRYLAYNAARAGTVTRWPEGNTCD